MLLPACFLLSSLECARPFSLGLNLVFFKITVPIIYKYNLYMTYIINICNKAIGIPFIRIRVCSFKVLRGSFMAVNSSSVQASSQMAKAPPLRDISTSCSGSVAVSPGFGPDSVPVSLCGPWASFFLRTLVPFPGLNDLCKVFELA